MHKETIKTGNRRRETDACFFTGRDMRQIRRNLREAAEWQMRKDGGLAPQRRKGQS